MTESEFIRKCLAEGGTVGKSLAETMAAPVVKVTTGHKPGRMNGTEKKHSLWLEARLAKGEITGYWFEEIKFRLADKTWYCPDFFVRLADGTYEVHEIKGFMRDDAAVKLKVAARLFPCFVFRLFYKGKEIVIPSE